MDKCDWCSKSLDEGRVEYMRNLVNLCLCLDCSEELAYRIEQRQDDIGEGKYFKIRIFADPSPKALALKRRLITSIEEAVKNETKYK